MMLVSNIFDIIVGLSVSARIINFINVQLYFLYFYILYSLYYLQYLKNDRYCQSFQIHFATFSSLPACRDTSDHEADACSRGQCFRYVRPAGWSYTQRWRQGPQDHPLERRPGP